MKERNYNLNLHKKSIDTKKVVQSNLRKEVKRLDRQALRKAIITMEILGKPKALRGK